MCGLVEQVWKRAFQMEWQKSKHIILKSGGEMRSITCATKVQSLCVCVCVCV